MDAKEIRNYHFKVSEQLEKISKRDGIIGPNFLGVLALGSFTALTEVAAQLSELKTVIRNASLRNEQKDN